MRINSAAYRVLTLSTAVAFMISAAKMHVPSVVESQSTLLVQHAGRIFGSAVIPAFLLWRNILTFKQRRPLIPESLQISSPWYYKSTMFFVWLALIFQFALPAAGVIVSFSGIEGFVAASLLLGTLAAAGLWLQAPTLFLMEVQCARHYSKPNNAMHATCEDARA